jgi:hypothetical protein
VALTLAAVTGIAGMVESSTALDTVAVTTYLSGTTDRGTEGGALPREGARATGRDGVWGKQKGKVKLMVEAAFIFGHEVLERATARATATALAMA